MGGGHPDYRLEFKADSPGVPGGFLAQGGGRDGAVQAAGQLSVLDKSCLLRGGSLVVERGEAAAGAGAVVRNMQEVRAELPAYMPFFKHSLVAEHEVGLALMAEGFMGENTGGQRRKNHGVFSGLYPL